MIEKDHVFWTFSAQDSGQGPTGLNIFQSTFRTFPKKHFQMSPIN